MSMRFKSPPRELHKDEASKKNDEANQEAEGEEKKLQLAKSFDTRTINSLPFHSPHNYSPHLSLEFSPAVQDYCRNQTNLINLSKCNESLLQQKKAPTTIRKKISTKFSQKPNKVENTQIVNNFVRNCKVVVTGDVAVGKTCLVNRFGHAVYSSTYQTTIGVDFDLQRFNILGHPYILQIWDTAGLERFKCITNSYYRGCKAALIVFDMSNMSSLADVVKWRDEIIASSKTYEQLSSEHNNNNIKLTSNTHNNATLPRGQSATDPHNSTAASAPLLFLVGTKCDVPLTETRRAFMTEQANKLASLINAELWFVSAQTGENVNELFNRIAALSFNRSILNELQQLKFDSSTMGACLKEKLIQQQRELWNQSSKLIKITRKKDGDERRTRCVNVQCVIK